MLAGQSGVVAAHSSSTVRRIAIGSRRPKFAKAHARPISHAAMCEEVYGLEVYVEEL